MENKQIVYIDESNILSKTGNSVYVCVYIEYINKENISQKIKSIEKDLKISYTHWVDMPWKLRLRFADKIKNLDFNCKIVVYKNPINQSKILEYFLLKVVKKEDIVYKIIIDGNNGVKYERTLKSFLRYKGVKVYKIKFVDDKNEPILRLTDFIAGSFRSYLDNRSKNNAHINKVLKNKIKILN